MCTFFDCTSWLNLGENLDDVRHNRGRWPSSVITVLVLCTMQALPLPLLVLVLSLLRYPTTVYADPATVPFTDCFDSDNTTQRVNVSTVYAQVLQNNEWGNYLNLTLLGDAPQSIQGLMHNAGGSLCTSPCQVLGAI